MGTVQYFNAMKVRVPWDKIYSRLGYREQSTRMDETTREETEKSIAYALSFINMRGAGRRVSLSDKRDDRVSLATADVFVSRNLSKYVGDCREILVMGATAGGLIMEAIRQDIDADNLTRGSILDAVASEMTDGALDWMCDYFNYQLKRENKKVGRSRYSAGYGDLGLEHQQTMFTILRLDQIGLSITDSHMLIPEKSVTAIARIMDV